MSKISELCNPTRLSSIFNEQSCREYFPRHKNNFWLTLYDMAMTRGLHSSRYSLWSMLLICEHCDSSKSHRKVTIFLGLDGKLFKKCWRWKIVRNFWWRETRNAWKLMKIWLKFMNIRGVKGGLSKSDR